MCACLSRLVMTAWRRNQRLHQYSHAWPWHECFQVHLVNMRKVLRNNVYGDVQCWLMMVKNHLTGFTAVNEICWCEGYCWYHCCFLREWWIAADEYAFKSDNSNLPPKSVTVHKETIGGTFDETNHKKMYPCQRRINNFLMLLVHVEMFLRTWEEMHKDIWMLLYKSRLLYHVLMQ